MTRPTRRAAPASTASGTRASCIRCARAHRGHGRRPRAWARCATPSARGNGSPWSRVVYTESHDEVTNGKTRCPPTITPDDPGSWYARKRSTLGAALVFTSPAFRCSSRARSCWRATGSTDDAVDWANAEKHAGILALYRDLIRLRRNWHDTTRGLRGPPG